MYENELQRIIDAAQNNALTFFVGAGVSTLSGAPSWDALIDSICPKIGLKPKNQYSDNERLQIPQMYYHYLGDDKTPYLDLVKEKIQDTTLVPNDIHRKIVQLDPISIITTNYDTLLEQAAIQYCHSYKVVSRDTDVPIIYGDRFILKIHGDFSYDNFVLKEEDYLNYSTNFKLIETIIKSTFSINTVVFIGYGFNDYDIKLIMNWVKNLLGTDFRHPIFISTEAKALSSAELLYRESMGFSVIETCNLTPSSSDYLPRYLSVFEKLNEVSNHSPIGKTDDESFELLLNLLKPLDHLLALRYEDVSYILRPYTIVQGNGVLLPQRNNLLNKFIKIHQMSESDKRLIPPKTLSSYKCILNVFIKAKIVAIKQDHTMIELIDGEMPFADTRCIMFDYLAMNSITCKEYSSPQYNYRKAYYLARLKRYDDSFKLFSNIARKAFEDKDYLLFFLSKSNCIYLSHILRRMSEYRRYDLSNVESLLPSDSEIENMFRWLPVEFRNEYTSMRDVSNPVLLYKYAYGALAKGQDLQEILDTNSKQIGLTASTETICKINDYLHFLLGNGIIADVFAEYHNAIKYQLSQLVFKYSTQIKNPISDSPFELFGNDKIVFDEIDFYCFIEYLTSKEILVLMRKHLIETLEFQNKERIECAVNNLIDYYSYARKHGVSQIELDSLILHFKNCMTLLRYVDISQELVDKICSFIFLHGFNDLDITDKIYFLDYQICQRGMHSEKTNRIIEKVFFSYLDNHIKALKNRLPFEVLSNSSGINYYNLVNYISDSDNTSISRRLSRRINIILSNKYEVLYPQVAQHYCKYVSLTQRRKIVSFVNKTISNQFDYNLFTILIQLHARINPKVMTQLKQFLREKISISSFKELEEVGYFCLIKAVPPKPLLEFVGSSNLFDCFYLYTKFDFKKFDVSWLINYSNDTIQHLAHSKKVRTEIRNIILLKLRDNTLTEKDSERLKAVLIDYFVES